MVRQLSFGGAQRQLITLANGLVSQGCTVAIVVFYPQGGLEKLLDPNVELHSLNKRNRWGLLSPYVRLVQFIYSFKPDVLYSFMDTSNIFSVCLKLFFPRVKVVWGIRQSYVDLDQYDWTRKLTQGFEKLLARFADWIIYNSHAGLSLALYNGYPISKSSVIPNGVDTSHFRADPQGRIILRKEWGILDQEHLVGIVGRLDPIKDHSLFIRVASELAQIDSNTRFVCVGNGNSSYQTELKNLSKELGLSKRLIWIDSRSDMPSVYSALDILVSSSLGEGFSNVIVEAMACGVPCVVTDVGDSRIIVGSLGWVAPPGDSQKLMGALQNALNDLPRINPQIIRSHIVENYSVERMVQSTLDALNGNQ
jgi:glycosyltransferase involved in cell wall biosynthesis